ncbi:hypothetical protein V7O66_09035 [Methanolobus sp. ZRKC3]
MKKLEECPKCNAELHDDENVQVCGICGYWTRKGTVRLGSIAILA